ncbi:unnamed protein product [Peniophora sp. CBMAI 1063]|nr:unnamed protein product [Peniophora sp. CBMAI 1063]
MRSDNLPAFAKPGQWLVCTLSCPVEGSDVDALTHHPATTSWPTTCSFQLFAGFHGVQTYPKVSVWNIHREYRSSRLHPQGEMGHAYLHVWDDHTASRATASTRILPGSLHTRLYATLPESGQDEKDKTEVLLKALLVKLNQESRSPSMDAALTAMMGLAMAFVGGVAYYAWYKKNVLDKIEKAFEGGYDPALELAVHAKKNAESRNFSEAIDELEVEDGPWTKHLRRREQDILDLIIHGKEHGHYFMLLGAKGAGKTTMILDSMQTNQAEGVAMCDAHPDLEVFRLRLGKALNYEYNEDTQTGLFQRRDPREGGPGLDIERVMNKLEKVALKKARKTGRPLVLVINNVHYFRNNDDGKNMLLQLQQRAESWAASGTSKFQPKRSISNRPASCISPRAVHASLMIISDCHLSIGIMTLVFTSDDFWPFFTLRQHASRMHTLTIYDLNTEEATAACQRMRRFTTLPTEPKTVVEEATSIVGGRLSYLNRIARARNMVDMAKHMLAVEKGWLLSQIGLIRDCDDDVMDEQKWSSCSWLLLQEFVKKREEQIAMAREAIAAGEKTEEDLLNLPLPAIPYYQCRQIMTRADFLEELDRINVISIDINHDVRPDSMLILRAAQEFVGEDGFQDLLDSVRDRIDEIESLHRTRELTFKDLGRGDKIKLEVDKTGDEDNGVPRLVA